jgi:hypothetical protein
MSGSPPYAPLLVVRQVDVPDPVPGSEKITCTRCDAACWVQPDAREVAVRVFGSDAAICQPCMEEELGEDPIDHARRISAEDLGWEMDGEEPDDVT